MKQSDTFKTIALNRISYFCNTIYIDEFQDYNGYDFKLIVYLLRSSTINIIAIGDIFQSLVANIRKDGNGSSLPFSKISSVNDLIGKIPNNVEIDTSTLIKSRRVAPKVCNFINKNLNIPIESSSSSDGEVVG